MFFTHSKLLKTMEQFTYLGTLGMGNSPVVYRSSVQIDIRKGDKHILQMAIVDSGSDITLMDFEIAQFLEIDLATCDRVNLGGIIGKSVGYSSEVSIVVEKFKKEISIPVVFTEELNTGILLGQTGFFDNYKITFDRRNRAFSLEENAK